MLNYTNLQVGDCWFSEGMNENTFKVQGPKCNYQQFNIFLDLAICVSVSCIHVRHEFTVTCMNFTNMNTTRIVKHVLCIKHKRAT